MYIMHFIWVIIVRKGGSEMNEKYVRERITSLRIKKGVSEYQMSYDLGHSRSYVNNISSGKVLPSMGEFLAICDYFEITPKDFFDEDMKNPSLIQEIYSDMKKLDDDDLILTLNNVKRLLKNKI